MIKQIEIQFKQQSAGQEEIKIEQFDEFIYRAVRYAAINKDAGLTYFKTKTVPVFAATARLCDTKLGISTMSQGAAVATHIRLLINALKKKNTEHWVEQFFDATTDCASLPQIAVEDWPVKTLIFG